MFRGLEVVEFCASISSLLQGESLNGVAAGMDITSHRVPLGVCGGIAPFNFPVMIPLWMFPIAITCGNSYVLKVCSGFFFANLCSHLKELPDLLLN